MIIFKILIYTNYKNTQNRVFFHFMILFVSILRKVLFMKIGKILGRFFSNRPRVIIAGEHAKYPLLEGRNTVQPEVPFFLRKRGILTPVSKKTREEFLKKSNDIFTHNPKRP